MVRQNILSPIGKPIIQYRPLIPISRLTAGQDINIVFSHCAAHGPNT